MTTLEEINEKIGEKEREKRNLWVVMGNKQKAFEEAESEWTAMIDEIRELKAKKQMLNEAELTKEEKTYVNEKLKQLEVFLNQPDIVKIQLTVAEPDHESKNLNIRIKTDFETQGLELDVDIWSNRRAVIDRVHSCIHVPLYKEEKETDYRCHSNYYIWTKEEYPNVQMFKL